MMRKHTFLIATAVTALTLGSGAAFAQGSPGSEKGATHSGASSQSATPSKGGEQNRMGQAQSGEKSKHETTGQASGGEHNRMSEGQKNKRETTGQAPSEKSGMKSSEKSEHEGNKATKPNESSKSKERTTGQGATTNERSGAKERNERNGMNEKNEKRGTNGQGANEKNNRSTNGQGTMENRSNSKMDERSGSKSGERNNTNVNEHSNTTVNERNSASSGSHTTVNLSSEQKTKIHTIIVGEKSAPRVAHVDFDVHVGTRVPRGKVHLATLPSSIVSIEPSWRGFEYFLVGDEIVVVDPASLEIVAVLPA
jgi:hypothetical protein